MIYYSYVLVAVVLFGTQFFFNQRFQRICGGRRYGVGLAGVITKIFSGGAMIVSTLLSYFTPRKPKFKNFVSVGLSFVGIMFLVVL